MFRQQQGAQFPNMNQPYQNTRIQPPNASQPTYSSPLDQVKQYTAKFEDILENMMDPIKPYVPFSYVPFPTSPFLRPLSYVPSLPRCLIRGSDTCRPLEG